MKDRLDPDNRPGERVKIGNRQFETDVYGRRNPVAKNPAYLRRRDRMWKAMKGMEGLN